MLSHIGLDHNYRTSNAEQILEKVSDDISLTVDTLVHPVLVVHVSA